MTTEGVNPKARRNGRSVESWYMDLIQKEELYYIGVDPCEFDDDVTTALGLSILTRIDIDDMKRINRKKKIIALL